MEHTSTRKNKPIGHHQDQLTLQKQIFQIEQNLLEIKEALLDGDYKQASRFASRLPQRTTDLYKLLNTMYNRHSVARGFSDANNIEISQLYSLNSEIADINNIKNN